MKLIKNIVKYGLVVAVGASLARATDPTTLAALETSLDTRLATNEGYAVKGLLVMAGISAAVVIIAWFRAAKPRR